MKNNTLLYLAIGGIILYFLSKNNASVPKPGGNGTIYSGGSRNNDSSKF